MGKKRSHDDDSDSGGESRAAKRTRPSHVPEIGDADYFARNAPFSRWLHRKRGVVFDKLPSSEARALFGKFCRRWNAGDLDEKYYADGPGEKTVRTDHKWSFTKDLTSGDKSKLHTIASAVDESNYSTDIFGPPLPPAAGKVVKGPAMPAAGAYELAAYAEKLEKKDRKDHRKHVEMVLDELAPKATGREAVLEKRRMIGAARREREESPEAPAESVMYASNVPEDFARRKARIQAHRDERKSVATEKLAEYKEREAAKLSAFMNMVKATRAPNALYQG